MGKVAVLFRDFPKNILHSTVTAAGEKVSFFMWIFVDMR